MRTGQLQASCSNPPRSRCEGSQKHPCGGREPQHDIMEAPVELTTFSSSATSSEIDLAGNFCAFAHPCNRHIPGRNRISKRSEQSWVPMCKPPVKNEPAHGTISSRQRYSVFVSLRSPTTLYTTKPVRRLQHQENSGMAFIYSVSATCGQC